MLLLRTKVDSATGDEIFGSHFFVQPEGQTRERQDKRKNKTPEQVPWEKFLFINMR